MELNYIRCGDYYIPELKAATPMLWVQRMNNIRNRAEEIVLRELVYGEAMV